MRGLLNHDPDKVRVGAELPLGWHWLYFREPLRQSALGPDGHEARGAFMPPVDLPRRMWAGGRLRSLRPVVVGEAAELRSQVTDMVEKKGRSGRLAFVTVGHTVVQRERRCVEEEQVVVYREAAGRAAASATSDAEPAAPEWQETCRPDPVALFRFSALTYNAHRIHYDRGYAQGEGYPDLVVHAPLTALMLMDAAARRWRAPVRDFEYRALSPLFVEQPVRLAGYAGTGGRTVEAWGPDGRCAMRGRIRRSPAAARRSVSPSVGHRLRSQ